jgi:tRNA(Ile2) C34 agmatinyltransferase TiaS
MDKYGVVLDNEKVKQANDKTKETASAPTCPVCGKVLDNAGACPEHGTEPFESDRGRRPTGH